MSKGVDIFVDSEQALDDFVADLSKLFTIEFIALAEEEAYQFRNGAIALTVRPNDNPQRADHRFHLQVTGDTYGYPQQRAKWSQDWGYDFYQALKGSGRYRVRRVID